MILGRCAGGSNLLLCVDVGNTQIVLGVYDLSVGTGHKDASWGLVRHFRLATRNDYTSDEMALLLSQMLALGGLGGTKELTGAVVSSTNPMVGATVVEAIKRWSHLDPLVVSGATKVGIEVRYNQPTEVGPDRVADAVAFLGLYDPPGIVVDFGTATTFDAINSYGEYIGGAIAPGVAVSLDALFSRAAALRRVEMVAPSVAIGRSTAESVQSGVIFGFAELVDGMCERFEEELGPCTVVGTGGLCSVVAPYTKKVQAHEPWLTLFGLRLIHEHNQKVAK